MGVGEGKYKKDRQKRWPDRELRAENGDGVEKECRPGDGELLL